MFVIITEYVRPVERGSPQVLEHGKYLDGLVALGELVMSGPQSPRVGGVMVVNVPDVGAAHSLMRADPLVRDGLVVYQIIEFTSMRGIVDRPD